MIVHKINVESWNESVLSLNLMKKIFKIRIMEETETELKKPKYWVPLHGGAYYYHIKLCPPLAPHQTF